MSRGIDYFPARRFTFGVFDRKQFKKILDFYEITKDQRLEHISSGISNGVASGIYKPVKNVDSKSGMFLERIGFYPHSTYDMKTFIVMYIYFGMKPECLEKLYAPIFQYVIAYENGIPYGRDISGSKFETYDEFIDKIKQNPVNALHYEMCDNPTK